MVLFALLSAVYALSPECNKLTPASLQKALAIAAPNLEILELEGWIIDCDTSGHNPEEGDFRVFPKLHTLTLKQCYIEALGLLPTTLVNLALNSSSRPWHPVGYEPMILGKLACVSIDYDNSPSAPTAYGISPSDLLRLLDRPEPPPGHGHGSDDVLPVLDEYYVPIEKDDVVPSNSTPIDQSLISLRVYICGDGFADARRDARILVRIIAGRCHGLRHMALRDGLEAVDDSVAREIASTCYKLESLSLENAMKLTGAGVGSIVRGLGQHVLKTIYLKDCLGISDPENVQQWALVRGVRVVFDYTKGRDGNGKKVRYGD